MLSYFLHRFSLGISTLMLNKINSTVKSNVRAQVHGVRTISLSVDGLCRFIKL